MLVCKHADGGDRLVPVESTERIQRQQQLFGVDYKPVIRCGGRWPWLTRLALARQGAGRFSPLIHPGPTAWGFGVLPLSRSCPGLRSPGLLGHFFHGSEAIGTPDVELTRFGLVTVLVTCLAGCGLEEVEMVGKEGAEDEAGGDGGWWAFKPKSSPSSYSLNTSSFLPLGFSHSPLLWVVSDGSRWWI